VCVTTRAEICEILNHTVQDPEIAQHL